MFLDSLHDLVNAGSVELRLFIEFTELKIYSVNHLVKIMTSASLYSITWHRECGDNKDAAWTKTASVLSGCFQWESGESGCFQWESGESTAKIKSALVASCCLMKKIRFPTKNNTCIFLTIPNENKYTF